MARSNLSRLPGLDTLRALAIVAVMLYHLEGYLPSSIVPVAQFGWMGVDLFFVLSGYLIGSQLLKPYASGDRPSIWSFYRRRAYRILPAYLVVLWLYLAFPAWHESPVLPPVWQFLTFTVNLFFVDFSQHAFSHVWSLCVEEHFYLVLPLLVIWLMRRPSLRKTVFIVGGVILFGICFRGYMLLPLIAPARWSGREVPDGFGTFYYRYLYYPTYSRLDGLVVGVTLALVRIFRSGWWSWLLRRGNAALIFGIALTGAVCWMFRNDGMGDATKIAAWGTVVGYPLLAVGLGLLVVSSVSNDGWLSRFSVPGSRLLATLAFSLYLTHKEIAHLDRRYLPSLTASPDWKTVVIYAVTCLLAAGLLYVLVERPFMVLRDRYERRVAEKVDAEMLHEPAL
ncbi:acyltransferase [Tunturiibacter empetritectus]|uniref:Peptidoglycan/LPS O-acetylase OafA/YrhL n=1 Tax=Tunturiibacter lichenicola TaxID=2051959 RepID=A0A852VGZ5_9BACT|nr:acyltransferase [Edaphobacter lichenicola]NYF92083.1 peptidoglycan/LPS O-acetylase OafA/YrhL [Edaphobacter lichenicola]